MRLKKRLRKFLIRLLDRLSAFCWTVQPEPPIPVPVRARRWTQTFLAAALLTFGGIGTIDGQDPFPSLCPQDLPVLTRGVAEHQIVLDRSVYDVPEASEAGPHPGVDVIPRQQDTDRIAGEWL